MIPSQGLTDSDRKFKFSIFWREKLMRSPRVRPLFAFITLRFPQSESPGLAEDIMGLKNAHWSRMLNSGSVED